MTALLIITCIAGSLAIVAVLDIIHRLKGPYEYHRELEELAILYNAEKQAIKAKWRKNND